MFTKVFAISEGLLPEDKRLSRLFRYVTLETGLLAGVLLVLTGGGSWLFGLAYWRSQHFGPLDPEQTLRIVIPGDGVLHAGIPNHFVEFFPKRSGTVAAVNEARILPIAETGATRSLVASELQQ